MQFERAIPGQSLTTPPKSAPYERPPEITDPLEALDWHLDKLDNPKAVQQTMFFLEMGVDLVSLVQGVLRNAVMEGMHSIDVSLIIAPVVHEYIKGYADSMNIKYEEGFEDAEEEQQASYARNVMLAKKMINDVGREMGGEVEEEVAMEEPLEETPEETPMMDQQQEAPEASKGLMARA